MEVFPLTQPSLQRGEGADWRHRVVGGGLSLNQFPLLCGRGLGVRGWAPLAFAQESDSPRKAAKAVSLELRDSEPDIAHKRRAGKRPA